MSDSVYTEFVKTCEQVWKDLRKVYPDIPEAVMVIASGGRRAPTLYGHFAKQSWEIDGKDVHEVLLVAENLTRTPEDIFTTIAHEAVHGIAHTRGIKDCSGRRHNMRFARLCNEMGLVAPHVPDKYLGFSHAVLGEEMKQKFAEQIAAIDQSLTLHRKLRVVNKEVEKTSWKAECGCNRKIRVGKKILRGNSKEDIKIICELCGTYFMVEDDDEG